MWCKAPSQAQAFRSVRRHSSEQPLITSLRGIQTRPRGCTACRASITQVQEVAGEGDIMRSRRNREKSCGSRQSVTAALAMPSIDVQMDVV